MNKLKKWVCSAACLLLLTALLLPAQAAEESRPQGPEAGFQNPDGMTVDLIYYYAEPDGTHTVVDTVRRAIIPAGTAAVTVEMQQRLLPQGHTLKDPRDLPLQKDTLEVRIQVLAPSEEIEPPASEPEEKPAEPETKPTEPAEKPTEPAEKPTEPAEKPTEPAEKPTEPAEKPTEPAEKPTEPAEKPTEPETKPAKPAQKPTRPAGKPDPTNPQTGDPVSLQLWLFLSISSAALLTLTGKFLRKN